MGHGRDKRRKLKARSATTRVKADAVRAGIEAMRAERPPPSEELVQRIVERCKAGGET